MTRDPKTYDLHFAIKRVQGSNLAFFLSSCQLYINLLDIVGSFGELLFTYQMEQIGQETRKVIKPLTHPLGKSLT